jgi:hypothetical protein
MSKFSGMSRSQCPAACKPDRCVITEAACCGHPCGTGVQLALRTPAVIERYGEACKILDVKHEVAAA